MTDILILDSNKATNNIYNLDKKIEGRWRLLSFVSTNNIYNVNDNNNKIYWNENGGNLTTTLTNGCYNYTDFATHLSTQLNASASGTITISFNENTRKLTISNDTHNFYFTFGTNTSNSARVLLGFNETDGTNSTSQTSTNPIDLNTYKNIFINIKQNNNRNVEGIDFFNTSFVINGTGTFGDTFRYINNDNFSQYVKFRNIKQVEITIHDLNNNSITLNSEYQLILQKIM